MRRTVSEFSDPSRVQAIESLKASTLESHLKKNRKVSDSCGPLKTVQVIKDERKYDFVTYLEANFNV